MSNQPKPAFYVALGVVILILIGLAVSKFSSSGGGGAKMPKIDLKSITSGVEAPDNEGITTAKEYHYVAATKLPPVKGISNYAPLQNRTVKFAINVWAGWGPIILANNGFKPGKTWMTPSGDPFKVELVLMDDPVQMRDAYAAGQVHIGWATVDMVPLFMDSLSKDSRVMPRIYQQIDWSNGGDGIVVRDRIKSISDLRGQTIVLAQNSPSQFFILNALINGGVQPSEVNFKYTNDAFEAAAAFNADKSIAGCVSWSPDIYKLSDVKGNRMLVNTQTANKLIADIWFARADFAKDHPEIMEGLVRGIFDGMQAMQTDSGKQQAAKLMADGYAMPVTDATAMLGDAHNTNYAENKEFFLNQNNPTNFERTWDTAYLLYRSINTITGNKTTFDQVMDFTYIQKLASEPKYASQTSDYGVNFTPTPASTLEAESNAILTKTVTIHFFPNSFDLHKKIEKTIDGKTVEQLYDPAADAVIEEVGKLAGQYGAARIVIEGHTDSSLKGQVGDQLVKELSNNRANAVKQAILVRFPTLQPNQFSAIGYGWDRPADPNDPMNQAKNRRVEIKVYPAEAPS